MGSPSHGIFLIRFHSAEFRDEVIEGGYLFFNKRPVIMKKWDADMDIRKNDVHKVPIWVH